MTTTDVATLYALLDESRKESHASLAEVANEVRGYRTELNGRLRRLEALEARRDGIDVGRGGVGRLLVSVAAVAAAVGSVVGVIVGLI